MYNTQEKAKQMVDIHVLWGQSSVIEELIQAGKIDEEYLYPFNGEEVLEWWLVTSWLADRLREQAKSSSTNWAAIGGDECRADRPSTWTMSCRRFAGGIDRFPLQIRS